MTTKTQALGAYGEKLAARLLTEELGMVLLDRNWRCADGELDLVLRDGDSEVGGSPHEAVDDAKLDRLHDLVWKWAEAKGIRPTEVRVDLVGILRPLKGRSRVDHVRGLA
jgi:putative endonuclease